MTEPGSARGGPEPTTVLRETEEWFVRHGLPYFVPDERESARAALHARRTAAMLAITVVVALSGGVALAVLLDSFALAPATLTVIVGLAVLGYAATALRAAPIARWAGGRTLGSLGQLLPMATRALPLLLVFVTFLFINAEVWEVSARLDGAVLWMTVLLFAVVAVVFLLVRLPDELENADRLLDDVVLVEACRHTPLESHAQAVIDEVGRDAVRARSEVRGFERANLVLVLVIAQAVQVVLLALSVLVFFMVFGGVVMPEAVQENWTGQQTHALPVLRNLSVELLQVSVFLASFSGLYFTVYAVTDDSYRDQFFTEVKRELERAVGVRAVYLELREPHRSEPGRSDGAAPA